MSSSSSPPLPSFAAVPKYTVFFDTNRLYTEHDLEIVSRSVTDLLLDLKSKVDLNIAVSKIVIEELLLKKLPKCQTILNEATKRLRDIQSLMEQQYEIPLATKEELEAKVRSRMDDWISRLEINVLDVPGRIDWEALVWKAVRRQRPFSPASDTKNSNEKGFKDAVILETLLDLYKKEPEREVVFVCEDGLLFETAREILHSQPRFISVNALTEFSAQVEVILATPGSEFLDAVVSKANREFFDPGDPNCVWLRLGVLDQISKSVVILRPFPMGAVGPRRIIQLPPRPGHTMDVFRQRLAIEASNEVHRVRETKLVQYDRVSKIYRWESLVELRQIFRSAQRQTAETEDEDQLRTLLVSVGWSSKVSNELGFSEERIETVTLASQAFEIPSAEMRVELDYSDPASGSSSSSDSP
jgi:PIN domain